MTIRGPTRARVASTHSATSSKLRGTFSISVFRCQYQREVDFHFVLDALGALPVALSHTEIEALEICGTVEFGARRARRELKIDRNVLRDPAQRERAGRAEARRGLGEAARHVMRRRPMRYVVKVGTAYGAVAIIVLGIDRIQVDEHVETRCRERVGSEIDGRSELVEYGLELRTGLGTRELQTAQRRLERVRGRRAGCVYGCAQRNARPAQRQQRSPRQSSHDRFSDLVNGSMRNSTSSLFQK